VSPSQKQRKPSQDSPVGPIVEEDNLSSQLKKKLAVPAPQSEMVITSNLTTLNKDGDHSSLDGDLDKSLDK
jgi:hypothetical protein